MKLTIIKAPTRIKNELTPGYTDTMYLDGIKLEDVTGYKISREATDIGFNITINKVDGCISLNVTDVEIKELAPYPIIKDGKIIEWRLDKLDGTYESWQPLSLEEISMNEIKVQVGSPITYDVIEGWERIAVVKEIKNDKVILCNGTEIIIDNIEPKISKTSKYAWTLEPKFAVKNNFKDIPVTINLDSKKMAELVIKELNSRNSKVGLTI